MFLSGVFRVSHVAMGVKLFLQIKASEMPDPGLSLLCGPAVACIPRLWQLGPRLWASSGHLCFMHALKEGTGDPAQSSGTGHARQTPALEMRKESCLQSASLLNKSEMKPWVFLRHFGISRLSVLAISISILQECSSTSAPFFSFSSKRLLSGATCD